ncbi:MAG: YXWGXW repeat-containing protein [Proteobacteria bacterium]|nr:YXWGXW repeat-containing protein [Pseudomonadota bacterium]
MSIGIGVSVGIPPPVLPVYAQPIIPGPGYIWTPGYWAWDPGYGGYYWVPGTWVMPPQVGLLWTPGWWGWSAGYYRWNPGYWGARVGFYGGVNYGYGYFGTGYAGGYWRGNDFFYNRAVNNINVTNIRNVYVNKTVINNVNVNRVSYNGGRGGLTVQPSAAQRTIANERRWSPTTMQTQQRDTAMRNPAQRFTSNQGRPAVFATQRAGRLDGPHTVRAPGAPNNRMVAAPERAREAMSAPNRRGGMVEAPRDRAQPAMRSAQPRHGERMTQPGERGYAEAQPPRQREAGAYAPRQREANAYAPRNEGPRARPAPAREAHASHPREQRKPDNNGHR